MLSAMPPAVPSAQAPATRLRGFHPGWFGAVMGTAMVGIVAYQDPGDLAGLQDLARAVGVLLVGLAALIAVVLGIPYVARWLRHPDAARADLADPGVGGLYGTFPGGLLVLAIGIDTVGPSVLPETVTAPLALILTTVGIVLAFVLSVAFTSLLFVGDDVDEKAANGSWFIPPVVCIVAAEALVSVAPHVAAADRGPLVLGGCAFWGMGFLLYLLVASLLYQRLVFRPLPAAPLAPSLWVGLGPLGAGSLALLGLARVGAPLWGDAAPSVAAMSSMGAAALWGFGIWWLVAVTVLLAVCLRRGPLPYGIGWWAFTFPLAAITASTLQVGRAWHVDALEALGAVLFLGLLAAWGLVAVRTVGGIRSGAAWGR